VSSSCQQLRRHCRSCRAAGISRRRKFSGWEGREGEGAERIFVKSLFSQLRSYRLWDRGRSSFYPAIDPSSSCRFLFRRAQFPIPGPILLCQTSNVCARIDYELFMVSERGRKSGFIHRRYRRTLYIIGESRLHERSRFSV